MKKTIITIAILLGLGMASFAQDNNGGGIFQKGAQPREFGTRENEPSGIMLPTTHGETGDQGAPVGSGIAVLVGLGAAYLVGKRHNEE